MAIDKYPEGKVAWQQYPVTRSATELLVGRWQVMQAWEQPLMETLARAVTEARGDVLEVGFGMGISANAIVRNGCRSYTVIEAHPEIAEQARRWAVQQSLRATVIEGFWEDAIDQLTEQFDGILFDTYPLSEAEWMRNHYPFIPVAPRLLRQDGVLTYFSDETEHFRPDHLHLLLKYFRDVRLIRVDGLRPPEDCQYWHADHMVVPVARNVS